MYYEERILGGKLMFRTTPDGQWQECSIEKAWDRIIALEDQVRELRSCMTTASNMLQQYT